MTHEQRMVEQDATFELQDAAQAIKQSEGRALQRVQTDYVTAVAVQKPRDIDAVVRDLDREVQYAKEDFYYAWSQGDGEIEGISYGGAMAIARAWGNCVVPPPLVRDLEDGAVEITASFVDLEQDFTCSRAFRHTPTPAPAKFANKADQIERWANMQFQVAQSKAIRNVVRAGVPSWLVARVTGKAREAVQLDINKHGIEATVKQGVAALAKMLGVPVEMMERAVVGKWGAPLATASVQDVEDLKTAFAAIKASDDRQMVGFEIFPALATMREASAGPPPPNLDAVMGANKTPPPAQPEPQVAPKPEKPKARTSKPRVKPDPIGTEVPEPDTEPDTPAEPVDIAMLPGYDDEACCGCDFAVALAGCSFAMGNDTLTSRDQCPRLKGEEATDAS